MIMSLKQKKIKFRPQIKLNHNFGIERWGVRMLLSQKKKSNSKSIRDILMNFLK